MEAKEARERNGNLETDLRQSFMTDLFRRSNHSDEGEGEQRTIDELLRDLENRRVRTRCCTCSCGQCFFIVINLFALALFGGASFQLIFYRNQLFLEGSEPSYWTEHNYENYFAFLRWGESASGLKLMNFSRTGFYQTFRGVVHNEEGWENLCSTQLLLDLINGKTDSAHCASSATESPLEGCTSGYYQVQSLLVVHRSLVA